MVKDIQNFDKVNSEPELLYYFEVKSLDMYNPNRPGKYQIAIFADHKNQHNIASVYKTGKAGALFMDSAMSSVHFKNKEFFKTYVVTLINQALKH
jgi:hypothetical protein